MIGFARRLAMRLGGLRRRSARSKGSSADFGDSQTVPLQLQSALSDHRTSEVLRAYLAAQAGGENLEFLLAHREFLNTHNSLQRFELLRRLVHRFLRADGERPVQITDNARRWVMQEWALLARVARVPADVRLPALEACARYIDHLVLRQSASLAAAKNHTRGT